MGKTIDWGTEEERRRDALEFVSGLLESGLKPEAIDASAQLALISAAERGPEHVRVLERFLDALDELVPERA